MYVIRERLFRLGEDSDITDEAGPALVARVVRSVVSAVRPSPQTGYLFRAPFDDAGKVLIGCA